MKPIPDTFRGSSSGTWKRTKTKSVIDVIIKGGTIIDIVDIPDGTTVRVWDYDVQGMKIEHLHLSPYDDKQYADLTYWE